MFIYFFILLSWHHQELCAAPYDSYTKCVAKSTASQDLMGNPNWCIPSVGQSRTTTLNIRKFSEDADATLVIPGLKNCQNLQRKPTGHIVIAVDNSNSLTETDPQNTRLETVSNFLRNMAYNNSSSFAQNSPSVPKIGSIVYAGRAGNAVLKPDNSFEYESDGLNPRFNRTPCANNLQFGADSFPSAGHTNRWSTRNQKGELLSICEYLPLTSLRTIGQNIQNSADTQIDFLRENTPQPRGATDYLYIFEAAKTGDLLGAPLSGVNAKNLIVISDGLPDLARRVPENVCQSKSYLKKNPILVSENGVKFCYDSYFRIGVNQAHDYVDNENLFQTVNIHHVLYSPEKNFVMSQDDEGFLNPADFLIENSARSGDGSVKFYRAIDPNELRKELDNIFNMTSEESLQYVKIDIQGPHQDSYHAVSSANPTKPFDLKFVGLQPGNYQIQVTYYYAVGQSQQIWNVNVGNTESSQLVSCQGKQDGRKTVDGDERDTLIPKGDGFFPRRDGQNKIRAYRNKHPLNALSSKYKLKDPNSLDPRDMRLQGGLGNLCGVSQIGSSGALSTHKLPVWVLIFITIIWPGLRYSLRRNQRGQS